MFAIEDSKTTQCRYLKLTSPIERAKSSNELHAAVIPKPKNYVSNIYRAKIEIDCQHKLNEANRWWEFSIELAGKRLTNYSTK